MSDSSAIFRALTRPILSSCRINIRCVSQGFKGFKISNLAEKSKNNRQQRYCYNKACRFMCVFAIINDV